jgi:uncharacterized protein YehS (DUF1456 family)
LLDNNDILRRLRYALNETDQRMIALFALKGLEMSQEQLRAYMGKEDEDGAVDCPDDILALFLDGLIIDRRGPPKTARPPGDKLLALTNNMVLKKLRIALNFHEEHMLEVLAIGGSKLSRSELTALFRKPDHKHYRMCGDQAIRNFLKGLTEKLRPAS